MKKSLTASLEGGKIARTYHVEDWQGAFRQVSQR